MLFPFANISNFLTGQLTFAEDCKKTVSRLEDEKSLLQMAKWISCLSSVGECRSLSESPSPPLPRCGDAAMG